MPKDRPHAAELDDGYQAPRRRRRVVWRWALLLLGPVAVLVGAAYLYLTGGRYVSTDNAYVYLDKIMVSADVGGRVVAVPVRENQLVAAGDLLLRIDPASYRLALEQATAQADQVRSDMAALRISYRQAMANLQGAEEAVAYHQRQFGRQQELRSRGVASDTRAEDAQHALTQARQQQAALRQEVAGIIAQLGGDPDRPIDDMPRYKMAVAQRDRALLDLQRTEVTAPQAGVVSNIKLEPGEHLAPGAPAFSLIPTDEIWVDANFKETDLTFVKPGNAATVTIDTYPGREWSATVVSLSPATGSQFSLLPAQNASGNWVKVVQRIPVRLQLARDPDGPALRAGMSAEVEIDTERRRTLPRVISGAFGRGEPPR